jgi:predicted amidohydrolase YtcJ
MHGGFGVAVHALGNDAIEEVLAAYERTRTFGARIEHAMFATARQAEKMARLGVTAVVQPGHLWAYGSSVARSGIDAYLPPIPTRVLLDAGVTVALSSDGPTAPWDPLHILRVAVDRRTAEGRVLRPDQAMTREEALRAATVVAAQAARVGEEKGSIEPLKQADLAVLTGDPFDPATRVRETWIQGRKVWSEDE